MQWYWWYSAGGPVSHHGEGRLRCSSKLESVGLASSKEHSVDHCDRSRGFQWNRMRDQIIIHALLRKLEEAAARVAEG